MASSGLVATIPAVPNSGLQTPDTVMSLFETADDAIALVESTHMAPNLPKFGAICVDSNLLAGWRAGGRAGGRALIA